MRSGQYRDRVEEVEEAQQPHHAAREQQQADAHDVRLRPVPEVGGDVRVCHREREPIPPLAQQDAIQRHGREEQRQIGERSKVKADRRRARRARDQIGAQADEAGAQRRRRDRRRGR